MRAIGITILIVILMVPQTAPLVPLYTRAGTFTQPTTGSYIKSIECESGKIVVVQFSADSAALEFFLVHSDFYDLAGLPEVSLCQFHIIAQSASHQFTTDRNGIWYLVFTNSPQEQEVSYEWNVYSLQEWNNIQFINWTILAVGIIVASIFIIRFSRKRLAEKSAVLD